MEAHQQLQLQLSEKDSQSVARQKETETQLRIRDEQILALQQEVTEVKDQLEAVETSRRRSLDLARERVEQWKEAQRQKPLPKKERQLETLMEGDGLMTSDNQTETGPQSVSKWNAMRVARLGLGRPQ
uniref:Uncharacterized protein n=1 Tax=Knipowitschia caucasica TaxID=637954 RepID=A0AAV2J797_KNICA